MAAATIVSAASGRQRVLERAAQASGAAWFEDWSSTLAREGRVVSGGWPGTLSEARQRVGAALRTVDLTSAELETLARTVYAVARKAWMARSVQDEGI